MPSRDNADLDLVDELITTEVAAQILDVSAKQVQRMVLRKQLQPQAYVSSLQRRFMAFRRSYIEDKREKLDRLRQAERDLQEE